MNSDIPNTWNILSTSIFRPKALRVCSHIYLVGVCFCFLWTRYRFSCSELSKTMLCGFRFRLLLFRGRGVSPICCFPSTILLGGIFVPAKKEEKLKNGVRENGHRGCEEGEKWRRIHQGSLWVGFVVVVKEESFWWSFNGGWGIFEREKVKKMKLWEIMSGD